MESGRTGGTNALRAAGLGAGILTAMTDIFKGIAAVWLAQYFFKDTHIIHVFAAISLTRGVTTSEDIVREYLGKSVG